MKWGDRASGSKFVNSLHGPPPVGHRRNGKAYVYIVLALVSVSRNWIAVVLGREEVRGYSLFDVWLSYRRKEIT